MTGRMAKSELESVATGTAVRRSCCCHAFGMDGLDTLKSLPIFFNLEDKYLIFVYSEVKCRTFLFLFKVCYFEVKYPHARE